MDLIMKCSSATGSDQKRFEGKIVDNPVFEEF